MWGQRGTLVESCATVWMSTRHLCQGRTQPDPFTLMEDTNNACTADMLARKWHHYSSLLYVLPNGAEWDGNCQQHQEPIQDVERALAQH